MLSIMAAFSSPELKAFPLHLRHIRSFGSAPSLPTLPWAARLVRFASQRRDSVIYSVPHPLHSINPTDSPDSRISVAELVVLSVGLCLSRKDRYLPLQPLCVRLLPRPTGLPAHGSRSNLSSAYADAKSLLPPSSPKMYSRLSGCASLTFISRETRSLFE